MISDADRNVLLSYARKYHLSKMVLFGSAKDRPDAADIDIGVKGVAAEAFFDFCWEVYRDLSKPVDVVDLTPDTAFNRLIERDGLVLYG